MKTRKRKYKCPLCNITLVRISNKKLIKSMCDVYGYKITRLILIKK